MDYLLNGIDQNGLSEKDNRDIAKDLNSLRRKLTNREDGPVNFEGNDIPDDDLDLFLGQVEIMLRRLKPINKKNIKNIVDHYVKKFDTRDPFIIAKYLNIQIQIGQLGTPCGCYMFLKNHRCIFMNENLSENKMKLVMSHELGHAVFACSKIELEANTFAINLLIPDDTIMEIIDNQNCTLEYMSRVLGYNQKLIELRMQ